MTEGDFDGYILAYDRDEIQFPVYVLAVIAAALVAGAFSVESSLLFYLGLAALGFAYYNFPLLEADRPRVGCSQYGIFIEGLGIVSWRATTEVLLVQNYARGDVSAEMHIVLARPLDDALMVDWRRRPILRSVMRLPWSLKDKATVVVPLNYFAKEPADIHQTFVRMLRFHRK